MHAVVWTTQSLRVCITVSHLSDAASWAFLLITGKACPHTWWRIAAVMQLLSPVAYTREVFPTLWQNRVQRAMAMQGWPDMKLCQTVLCDGVMQYTLLVLNVLLLNLLKGGVTSHLW